MGPLIVFRPFLNSDPPHLAALWRTQAPQRGLVQPVSTALLEQLVFAKPYFDNEGLIVAVEADQRIGFAHAGFGANEDGSQLSTQLAATCMLMVRPDRQRRGIGRELLARSEDYLRGRGAKVLYGGGIRPLNSFYLGLYGGSEMPGVLASTPHAQAMLEAAGYDVIDHVVVLHLGLAGLRVPIDRRQMQIRRSTQLQVTADPPTRNWWEACTYGIFDQMRYELVLRDTGRSVAEATFWLMQPYSYAWRVQTAGLINVEVDAGHLRQGLATFLLSEALRMLKRDGIGLIEAQTMVHNAAAQGLYRKLGFEAVDQGTVLRKR